MEDIKPEPRVVIGDLLVQLAGLPDGEAELLILIPLPDEDPPMEPLLLALRRVLVEGGIVVIANELAYALELL